MTRRCLLLGSIPRASRTPSTSSRGQVGRGDVPSAVLAVANREGLVRVEAFSGADAAAADSIYLLASISKPITATAVMQLVERGLLVLSAPVQRYLPEFVAPPVSVGQPGAEAVTCWHLLTHTSGLVDMESELLNRERPDRERLLEIACTSPLRFAPGTRFEYNSLSFALLGEVIARLAGRDYPEVLAAELFGPLGMRDSRVRAARSGASDAVAFPGHPGRAPGAWRLRTSAPSRHPVAGCGERPGTSPPSAGRCCAAASWTACACSAAGSSS